MDAYMIVDDGVAKIDSLRKGYMRLDSEGNGLRAFDAAQAISDPILCVLRAEKRE